MEPSKNRLIPLARWHEYHNWPTEASLKFLIHKAKEKHFEDVFFKTNNRIIIDEQKLFEWFRIDQSKPTLD